MREDSLMTHDQMVAKWMENPEFREVVFELDAQYAALDKALTKGKPNCFGAGQRHKKTNTIPFRPPASGKACYGGQALALEDLKGHLHY